MTSESLSNNSAATDPQEQKASQDLAFNKEIGNNTTKGNIWTRNRILICIFLFTGGKLKEWLIY